MTIQKHCGLASLWALAAAVMVLLGSLPASAQTAGKISSRTTEKTVGVRDFRSPHFLVHTDLEPEAARDLLKRLETMLKLIAAYWGRPPSGIIECWVVKDLQAWPPEMLQQFDPQGLAKIKEGAGVSVGQTLTRGNRFLAKARVYAVARGGVPQHEAVHGYAQQTFGRTGPQWYAEGMAEIGQYWQPGVKGVNAVEGVIRYLRSQPPKPLTKLIVNDQRIGGTWKDYAWWWSFCHFLDNNPNYSAAFRALGPQLLAGRDTGFRQVFGPRAKELEFEYRFFLAHLERGLRSDLCGWNWNKKFIPLRSSSSAITATVKAGSGWQPSSAILQEGAEYSYKTTGKWKVGKPPQSVSAAGTADGLGRLEGAVLTESETEYALSKPFDLGESGTFRSPASGNLYLRCKVPWTDLPDGAGKITVRIQLSSKKP
ncbi:MAG: hypothetical protein JXB10_00885 [Pirellulales bacterium]|nr:hypothetical protein [Pirellulales bacterium]